LVDLVIVVFALERLVITVVLCAGVRSGAFAYQLAVTVSSKRRQSANIWTTTFECHSDIISMKHMDVLSCLIWTVVISIRVVSN
jgi:hypothetical protein